MPLKGTQVPSGKCCQADARRRFGDIYIRRGNRVGIYGQNAYFEASEKMMQINKNPERLSPFLPFFGSQQLTTPHENEMFWPAGFSATCREELHHLPGERQTRGKKRFFIDDVCTHRVRLPLVN